MNTKANGREKLPSFYADPFELVIVGVDTQDGREHPLWDARSFVAPPEEFIAGIIRRGVRKPVLVKKRDDGRHMIVDGRKRVLGARLAIKRSAEMGAKLDIRIPCLIVLGSDVDLETDVILLNQHRVDDGPGELADKLLQYLDHGHTMHEAQIYFMLSKQKLLALLALAQAPKEIRKAFDEGRISFATAVRTAKQQGTNEAKLKSALDTKKRGRPRGPSRAKVERVLEAANEAKEPPHPEFLRALNWVLGRIDIDAAGVADLAGKAGAS